jgi:hypothetical protein
MPINGTRRRIASQAVFPSPRCFWEAMILISLTDVSRNPNWESNCGRDSAWQIQHISNVELVEQFADLSRILMWIFDYMFMIFMGRKYILTCQPWYCQNTTSLGNAWYATGSLSVSLRRAPETLVVGTLGLHPKNNPWLYLVVGSLNVKPLRMLDKAPFWLSGGSRSDLPHTANPVGYAIQLFLLRIGHCPCFIFVLGINWAEHYHGLKGGNRSHEKVSDCPFPDWGWGFIFWF